ncbi:MAG: ribosome biogenesis GTP-binding protein YihA/YsxC [Gemmatimonas sp.]
MSDRRADVDDDARRLFAQPCEFVAAATVPAALPPPDLPEVAFAGRSNVGKSSLINALVGRRGLARASKTPGATKTVNFFDLGGRLMLVDLPGYGYAQVGRSRVREWTRLANDYLKGRQKLRRVCLLIDARVGLKDSDEETMKRLDQSAVSYQIVLTKADELTASDLGDAIAGVTAAGARHVAAHPEIIATSARDGTGIDALRATLAALATPGQSRYSPRP